jgi:cytoskeletal protein RodZ
VSGEVVNANQSPPEIETDSQVERGSSPGVGALLHASRLRCGEELRDVAQVLRIRYVHLEAIEAGRFADLPGPAYAVGFVRAYAKHLGLDADEVVKRFRSETTDIGEAPELSFPVPVPEGGIPGGAVLFVGVVIAVLAYGGWYVSSAKEGFFTELVSPLPDRLAALLTPGDSSTPAPDTAKEDGKGKAGNASSPAPATAAVRREETPSSPEKPDQGGQDQMADEPASSPPAQSETSAVDTSSATGPAAEAGPPDAPEPRTTETASTDAVPAAEARDAEEGAGASTPGGGGQARPDEEKAAEKVAENVATGDSGDAGGGRAVPAAAPTGDSQSSGVDRESAPAGTPQAVASGDAAGAGEPSQPAPTADGGRDTAPFPPPPAADTSVAGEGGSASATVEAPAARADGAPAAIDSGGSGPAVRDGAEPPREVAAVPPTNDASAGTTRTGRVFGTDNTDSRILVRAKMNSWIQVRDDNGNRLLLTRLLRAGDTYRVPNRPGLKLLTGNAGALEILVDGETVPSIGPLGAVRRGVALDIERLRRGTAIIE